MNNLGNSYYVPPPEGLSRSSKVMLWVAIVLSCVCLLITGIVGAQVVAAMWSVP